MKKLSLIICLIMMISVFAGCGGEDTSSTVSNASGAVGDGIFSTETVKYKDDDGSAAYRIIRGENASTIESESASKVFKSAKSLLNINMKNQVDTENGTDVYEILIGRTNRPETAQVKTWLIENVGGRYDDYIVCTVGKKIVVYGMTDEALSKAVDYFVNNYFKGETVDGGIKYTNKTEGEFKDITINGTSIAKFNIVRPRYNTSYLTYAEVEKLVQNVRKVCGFNIEICDDTVTAENEYEIIIGDCQRPNVATLSNRDEYSVKLSGKKIYITGGAHTATTVAVTEFTKKLNGTALTDADSFTGSYTATVAGYDTTTYYTPKFFDDFDGDQLDLTKWNWRGGNGNSGWSSDGVNGSRADRSLDPSRVFVKDGLFQIHPYYDADNNVYYGGFIETNGIMKLTYGYVEMSCKIPDAPGFWTSMWLRCNDASGLARPEIDISESFGNGQQIAANMHTWPGVDGEANGVEHTSLDENYKNDKKLICPDGKSFNDDFHTFGVLWTDEVMWFTGDGIPYFKYTMGEKVTDQECFGKRMWIVVSEAVGFANNTDPQTATADEWENKSQYYVDWVYAYQIDDGKQLIEFVTTQD